MAASPVSSALALELEDKAAGRADNVERTTKDGASGGGVGDPRAPSISPKGRPRVGYRRSSSLIPVVTLIPTSDRTNVDDERAEDQAVEDSSPNGDAKITEAPNVSSVAGHAAHHALSDAARSEVKRRMSVKVMVEDVTSFSRRAPNVDPADRRQKTLQALSDSIVPILIEECQAPMMVVPYKDWLKCERIPRSSDRVTRLVSKSSNANRRSPSPSASASMNSASDHDDDFVVFVSHRWWNNELPDDDQNSKYMIVTHALDCLISHHDVDPARLVIWVDFACIDQDDKELQAQGIASLISYAARSDTVVTPVQDEPDAIASFSKAEHPADLHNYGERAWCRLETYIFMCVGEVLQRPIACFGYGKSYPKAERNTVMRRLSSLLFTPEKKEPEWTLKALSSSTTDTDLIEQVMRKREISRDNDGLEAVASPSPTNGRRAIGTNEAKYSVDSNVALNPSQRRATLGLQSSRRSSSIAPSRRPSARRSTLNSTVTTITSLTRGARGAGARVGDLKNAMQLQGAVFAEEQLPSSGSLTVEADREVIRDIQEKVMQTYVHYAILSQCTLAQLLDEDAEGEGDVSIAVCGKQVQTGDLQLLGTQLKEMSFTSRITHIDLRRNLIRGGEDRMEGYMTDLFKMATSLEVLRLDENPLLCSIGVRDLAPSLESASNLKVLGLSHCCLSNDALVHLCRNQMPISLEVIDVTCNLMNDNVTKAAAKLYKMFRSKGKNIDIMLEGNHLSHGGYTNLISAISYGVI